MTRILLLALVALSLLMLVAAARSFVEVMDYDLAPRVYERPRRYNDHVALEHGPYVRLVRLRLPSGDRILLYQGPFDNAAEPSGRSPAWFLPCLE